MICFVQLQTLLQRALTRSGDRTVLRRPSAQYASVDAVPSRLVDGRSQPNDPVDVLAALNHHTDWPTHRIRCFLQPQPVRGTSGRR